MSGWSGKNRVAPTATVQMADVFEAKTKPKERRPDARFMYRISTPLRTVSQLHAAYPVKWTKGKMVLSPILVIYSLGLITSALAVRIYYIPWPQGGLISWMSYFEAMALPVAVLANSLSLLIKQRYIKYCYNGIISMSACYSVQDLQAIYRLQIIMISCGYLFVTGYVIISYFAAPVMFSGMNLLIRIIEWFFQMNMIIFKFQFFFAISYLRKLLNYLAVDIGNLAGQPTKSMPTIMVLYENVCVAAEAAMQGFGIALGVSTTLTTVDCIMTAYGHFVLSQVGDPRGSIFTLWLLIELLQQWVLLAAAEMYSWQCSRLPIAVHAALAVVKDTTVIDQLRQFSMYLLHRRVKFTICGVVPLDYSLLFTIVGGVTSYMIVLLQFQRSEDPVNQYLNSTKVTP